MTEAELAALEASFDGLHSGWYPRHTTEALVAEVRRLRGLVREVETIRHCGQGDYPEHVCPFCWAARPTSGDSYRGRQSHRSDCTAFTEDGQVK